MDTIIRNWVHTPIDALMISCKRTPTPSIDDAGQGDDRAGDERDRTSTIAARAR